MWPSVFDLFSIGIGPSSSHTVGPMRAANRFVADLRARGELSTTVSVEVELFGSLAATGAGHGTMTAILLGLEGHQPELITTETKDERIAAMLASGEVLLGGEVSIPLTADDMVLHAGTTVPPHPNTMLLKAFDADGACLAKRFYYSVGGGFVLDEDEFGADGTVDDTDGTRTAVPYGSAADLLAACAERGCSVSEVAMLNESVTRSRDEVRGGVLAIWDVMDRCVRRGVTTEGELPGGLGVHRRAKGWRDRLVVDDPIRSMSYAEDWVNLVALAVNEENAAGGRVVTAPTNGAAGIIPAVLHYARRYTPIGRADADDVTVRFLLTAGVVGGLIKMRASISGADVGCQGEVGSAAAMAAAGLAEILGGTPEQVENAAEIAMEHSLGLTCDPIGGLVQIPCIERNAISAGKAINAARMALRGNGSHHVSLDQVIETMRSTGADMHAKYKETSTGGLAIHVPISVVEC